MGVGCVKIWIFFMKRMENISLRGEATLNGTISPNLRKRRREEIDEALVDEEVLTTPENQSKKKRKICFETDEPRKEFLKENFDNLSNPEVTSEIQRYYHWFLNDGNQISMPILVRTNFYCLFCGGNKSGDCCKIIDYITLKNRTLFPFVNPELWKKLNSAKGKKKTFAKTTVSCVCENCILLNNCMVTKTMAIKEDEIKKNVMKIVQNTLEKEVELNETKEQLEILKNESNLDSPEMTKKIADKIKNEISCWVVQEKSKGVTMSKLQSFDLQKSQERKKNLFFSKILNCIVEERKKGLSDIYKKKFDVLAESLFVILGRITKDLKFNSKFAYHVSLVVKMFSNSDMVETIMNKVGIGLSSSKIDTFYNTEGSRRYKIKKPEIDKTFFAVVDNMQNPLTKGIYRLTQDINSENRIMLNYTFASNQLPIENSNKYDLHLNKRELEKIKFKHVYDKKKDEKVFVEFSKHEFERIKVLYIERGNMIQEYIDEMNKLSVKRCSNPDCLESFDSSSSRRKCDCGQPLPTKSELVIDQKRYKEELKKGYDILAHARGCIPEKYELRNTQLQVTKAIPLDPGKASSIPKIIKATQNIGKKIDQKNCFMIWDGSPNYLFISEKIKNALFTRGCVARNGLFHTYQEFCGIFLLNLRLQCPDIITKLGYETERSKDFICGCGDMHQVTICIEIIFDGVSLELLQMYVEHLKIDKDKVQGISYSDFRNWVLQNKKDTFYMALYSFSSLLRMFKLGVQKIEFEWINSSSRLLDKFLFTKLRNKYQVIRLFEEIESKVFSKREYGDELNKLLNEIRIILSRSMKSGDMCDAKQEEMNKQILKLVGNPTVRNFVLASILFDGMSDIKKNLFGMLDIKDRIREQYRIPQVVSTFKMGKFLRENRTKFSKFSFSTVSSNGVDTLRRNGCSYFEKELEDRLEKTFDLLLEKMKKRKKMKLKKKFCRDFKYTHIFSYTNEDDAMIDDDKTDDDDYEGEEIEFNFEDETESDEQNNNKDYHEIVPNGRIDLMTEKDCKKLQDPKLGPHTCCGGEGQCKKEIRHLQNVGCCDNCRRFFQENDDDLDKSCGMVFLSSESKVVRAYCKVCIEQSSCYCGEMFKLGKQEKDIDICLRCAGLFHAKKCCKIGSVRGYRIKKTELCLNCMK